jgi:hypothetical protein
MKRLFFALMHAHWLRGALAALLLLTQHGALTHALLHASSQAHGGMSQVVAPVLQLAQSDRTPAHQVAKSCVFDSVYSQVLGLVVVAASGFQIPPATFDRLTSLTGTRVFAESPPFRAQAPPAFL